VKEIEPPLDCDLCPRLADFRNHWQEKEPEWFNAPVPTFGNLDAKLLIVGLAPGLRGANRTGRPFTGDYAGDLLYPTLLKFGWAQGPYEARPDDGLRLKNAAITNAVRCVPPQNKPETSEIRQCNGFLKATIQSMPNLQTILALGKIAHDSVLRALGEKLSQHKFGHAAKHRLTAGINLIDSYHCSRYNTNTGKLTTAMFESVFKEITFHKNTA
jgi:uracil-DNA glycosylase family 4